MKFDKKSLFLYAVTDRSFNKELSIYKQVEQALEGGITCLQLREKELSEEKFLEEAFELKKLAHQHQVPFFINDNVSIAKVCEADGVHVGQSDMEALRVREILGEDKIIGVSVATVNQAILAESQGADYLGVGAIFSTSTKQDANPVSIDILKEICQAVDIPVVAIGGIQMDNIDKLKETGIQGVAVVSAIFGSDDIRSATKELVKKVKDIVND